MLWIRTQQRDELIKVDRIQLDGNMVWAIHPTNGTQLAILAVYKNSDEALEVLDRIHVHINDYEWSAAHGVYHSRVFEMPEK